MGMVKTIRIDVTTSEDLWPYQTVEVIQRVMEEGVVKHPDGEWKNQSAREHMERAHDHLAEAREAHDLRMSKSEDHLAHAFTRLMMAVAIKGGYMDVEEDEFAKRERETEEKIRKGSR